MMAGHTLGQLVEQWHHHLLKLRRLNHVQDLFQLVKEHNLLGRVYLGPVPQQVQDDLLRQTGVLLQELDDAVGQLRVVNRQGLNLVQRHQNLQQEDLVLFFEWQGESVDDGAKDLQQFRHPVVSLRLVDEAVEDVVDLLPDVSSQSEELAVNPVESRFQEISLSRVFRVKELEQLKDELLVDVLLDQTGLEVGGLKHSQEELVDQLQVWPGRF